MFEQPEIVDPTEMAEWNGLIASHPDHSFFHCSEWARTLLSSYGYRPVYFVAGKAGGFSAVLPVMEVNSRLTGKRGVSLPFSDHCVPLCDDQPAFDEIVRRVIEFGGRNGWRRVEFRCGRCFRGDVPASAWYYRHTLEIGGDEGALFAGLDSNVRRAIRKAENAGIKVTVSDSLDAVRAFYRLNCMSRKGHGLPPQPWRFFDEIHRCVFSQGKGVIAMACHGGKPVAAAVFFRCGTKVLFKYGASDARYLPLRGNNLVMWEGIKWHARKACTELCMGRTAPENAGLRRYKLGWGTEERKIEYFRYDVRKKKFVAGDRQMSGWQEGLFRRMPIPFSRLIGTMLYRHVG